MKACVCRVMQRAGAARTLWAQREAHAALVEELEPVEAHVERVAPRGEQTEAQREAERHLVPARRPAHQQYANVHCSRR